MERRPLPLRPVRGAVNWRVARISPAHRVPALRPVSGLTKHWSAFPRILAQWRCVPHAMAAQQWTNLLWLLSVSGRSVTIAFAFRCGDSTVRAGKPLPVSRLTLPRASTYQSTEVLRQCSKMFVCCGESDARGHTNRVAWRQMPFMGLASVI